MTSESPNYLSCEAMRGYALVSKTGTRARFEDVLFGGKAGKICHIVFSTALSPANRYFLLDPDDVGSADHEGRVFPALLSDENLESSRNDRMEVDGPERDVMGAGERTAPDYWSILTSRFEEGTDASSDPTDLSAYAGIYSAHEMAGFSLQARDDDAGVVTDVLFDPSEWRVRYLVVATGTMFNRRQVLICVEDMDSLDRRIKTIKTSLLARRVENSPEFDRDSQTASSRPREVNDQFVAVSGGRRGR